MVTFNFKTRIVLVAAIAAILGASVPVIWHKRKANANAQKKRSAGHKRVLSEKNAAAKPTAPYGEPHKIADLEDESVDESSGIIASRTNPGLYWTHNDSGAGPFVYAFDEKGKRRGVWRVTNAKAEDWEAISIGPGPDATRSYLYVGDIGDSNEGGRVAVSVYRFPEPVIKPSDSETTEENPGVTESAERLALKYPTGSHDAEALLVHPVTGNLYIVTKVPFEKSLVFKATAPLSSSTANNLKLVAELKIPSMFGGIITDGSISPDGTRVALCDYLQGYEFVLSDPKAEFDTIWQQPLNVIGLGRLVQREGITYRLDGRSLLQTSEGEPTPLWEIVRR